MNKVREFEKRLTKICRNIISHCTRTKDGLYFYTFDGIDVYVGEEYLMMVSTDPIILAETAMIQGFPFNPDNLDRMIEVIKEHGREEILNDL